jgi:hypothetical protein
MNKLKSSKSKLNDAQRELVFNEFDRVQKILASKGISYIRRFSEPRKNGLGYRCKWWYVNNISLKVLKSIKLPEGWSLEIVSGYYRNSIALYTSKF